MPVTGKEVFGREEDIAFLDAAWANQNVNVVRMYVIHGYVRMAEVLPLPSLILNELHQKKALPVLEEP